MDIFEGMVMQYDSIDICNRVFCKSAKVTFPKTVLIIDKFDPSTCAVIGVADLTLIDSGIKCCCTMNTELPDDAYFVGGYYDHVKFHEEDGITVIDSARLLRVSILSERLAADKNLKIERRKEKINEEDGKTQRENIF